MGENLADKKPASACSLHHSQDPSQFTSCQLDSAEPIIIIDKKRMMKRKISPNSSLDQLDSVRSSNFSFGLEPISMVDPNPTPRFGPLPPVIEEVEVEEESISDRESKKRKHCPSYIVSNFSFNLDHNGSPESTPKFGSFTLTPTDHLETERDREIDNPVVADQKEEKEEEEEEEEEGEEKA